MEQARRIIQASMGGNRGECGSGGGKDGGGLPLKFHRHFVRDSSLDGVNDKVVLDFAYSG